MDRLLLSIVVLVLLVGGNNATPPHIVMIFVDDMGWNDVSWHNGYVIMPNIDRLARSGVILNQAYAQQVCTPSRAALLTGKYPVHIGLQEDTITASQLNGLPLNLKLLPEYLKTVGNYKSYMVGKWHLGYCNDSYIPLSRGFDSHYGFYLSGITYESHEAEEKGLTGLDYRDDRVLNVAATGKYATTDFTDAAIAKIRAHDVNKPMFLYAAYNAPHSPFEANSTYTDKYPGLPNGNRKTYLAMISALDDQVKRLEDELIARGMWSNTVLVFYSDNGGVAKQSGQGGNNYPLRGNKGSLWEGGYRVPAFVTSPLLSNSGYVYDGLVHISDMFATFIYLAGNNNAANIPASIDGKNMWESISQNLTSKRDSLVYNIISKAKSASAKNRVKPKAAMRFGDYKIIEGTPSTYVGLDSWVKPPENSTDIIGSITTHQAFVQSGTDYYLFNLKDDPNETKNLASTNATILSFMIKELRIAKRQVVHAIADDTTTCSDPNLNTPPSWSPGFCPVQATCP